MKALGIDLTGSEKRASGLAFLNDYSVIDTKRVNKDVDIIDLAWSWCPDVISIDSPLSLPEDPAKIYRHCELELKRRGIGVYWCLLPSMKALTLRGIHLKDLLHGCSVKPWKVIESYPGAAQDLLGVPRKQKGLDLLRNGLKTFGIKGNLEVSHDELDAVTAAIVGLLYLKGDYEALGCLILPKKASV